MARIINVIGGSGFIGTVLIRRLIKNNKIFNLDKSMSSTFAEITNICDVRSVEDLNLSLSEESIIINLAAEHRDDVTPTSLYDDVNVQGAKNICYIANKKKIHTIIFTSSVAVYGLSGINANEDSPIKPFNNYGRTKHEAELIYDSWQREDPGVRKLVIIRPTAVFGEGNRANIYNLFRQVAVGKFLMIGTGENRKSIAYVENVAAFVEHTLSFGAGRYIYNYVDKPDFTMNSLVKKICSILNRKNRLSIKIPYLLAYLIAKSIDLVAFVTRKKFSISAIRIKKFCSNSIYDTSAQATGFIAPYSLDKAIERTLYYEFGEINANSTNPP